MNPQPTVTAAVRDELKAVHTALGAVFAGDGIPLHYGDRAAEYDAALNAAVIMDRSHEGRLRLVGRDRLALPDRISTNTVDALQPNQLAPTLFLNPNARILDRASIYNAGDSALMLTEPGRAEAVYNYLRRNIFYNDEMSLTDQTATTRQFVLIGTAAILAATMQSLSIADLQPFYGADVSIAGVNATLIHDKSFPADPSIQIWRLIVPADGAAAVWTAVLDAGKSVGLRPAGSLTYHAMRVRSGRPGVNAELSSEYIPLEVGLWDEISFAKGCYTGQEIIARMDSRRRLARTIVRVRLDALVNTPSPVLFEGRAIGTLTSAAETPHGEKLGIAVVKLAHARPGMQVMIGDGVSAVLIDRAGVQPELQEE